MPTVKTDTLRINGRDFRRVVKFNPNGGFTISLPEEWAAVLGCDNVRADRLAAVLALWNTANTDYTAAATVESKVILYRFHANAYVMDEQTGKCLLSKSMSFVDGHAVEVCASVATEQKITLNGKTTFKYVLLDSTIPDPPGSKASPWRATPSSNRSTCLPWSEQREAFFARLVVAIQRIALDLHEIDTKPGALLKAADSGRLLLQP
jgi:hypothetical protein